MPRKKKTLSRKAGLLADEKSFGREPNLSEYTHAKYVEALNWYNYMCSMDDARAYIEDFLILLDRESELVKFRKVPDNKISKTCGWIARMMTKGYNLEDRSILFFEERLKESLNSVVVERKQDDAPVINIQDRIKEKSYDILGAIEEMIDSPENGYGDYETFYDWLEAQKVPAVYGIKILGKYVPLLQELLEAMEGKDKQLVEAYSNFSKKQLKEYMLFVDGILTDTERYSSNVKKVRAPRKPKPVSVEKQLKTFKYQIEDKTFKIASIQPDKVIGAQELWTFNPKYKILTVLRSNSRDGLKIKGSTFLNVDEENSFSRRTGRKPEYYVDRVLNGGKVVLRKIMDELPKSVPLTLRSNVNTILLRVL